MLASAPPTPQRDRTAIGISIALHCCALAVLAMLPGLSVSTAEPDERALLVGQIRIEHRPPPRVAVVRRAPAAPAPVPPMQAARPVIHTLIATGHAARAMVVETEARAAYVPQTAAAPKTQPVVRYDATRIAAVATQRTADSAAQTAATSAPASPGPSPVAARGEDGVGNFGETYPASVEPSLRATLFAGISGIVVRITVDEVGHATSIEFVRAPADTAQREELRTRLLAAHFIPANCNGLRCSGTVELKN
jgi:hypothetical protein